MNNNTETNEGKVRINISLSPAVRQRLDEIAAIDGVSVSAAVTAMINAEWRLRNPNPPAPGSGRSRVKP